MEPTHQWPATSGHRLNDTGDGRGAYGVAGGDDFSGDKAVAACACGWVSIFLAALFCSLCLGTVPPLTYGIKYNSINKKADTDNVVTPGRHLILPWTQFLLFPSNIRTIEFAGDPRLPSMGIRYQPLHTRTTEGLALHMHVSLQYRLKKEMLGQLYSEFNKNYEQVFISSVRDTLIKAASEYDAQFLWKNRSHFGAQMQTMVNKALHRTHAECWGLQLLIIDLPPSFETSIVSTQVRKQTVRSQRMTKESTRVRAETTVIKARFDKQVKIIMSQGHANYTFITKQAEARAQQLRIDTEADVLTNVSSDLGITGTQLITYQKYGMLDDMDEARVYYNWGSAGSQLLVSG